MTDLPPLDFAFPMALAGLVLLLPVIILYLLKPKPKHIRFPSVMFILRAEKSKRLRTFFKKIVRDPLLVLQLMVIALLVGAAAQPYLLSKQEQNLVENAVIVFDSSASMLSSDVSPDRISRAKEVALEILSKMNPESVVSIVLAENVPIILAKDLSRDEAKEAVKAVFASDSPTNVGDAVLFARNLLPEQAARKKIYVLSDLAQMDGPDLRLVGKIIEQSNASISFVRVNGLGENTGIIELKARRFPADRSRFSLSFTVKNYAASDREVEAEVYVDSVLATTLRNTVPARSEKFFAYEGTVNDSEHRITVSLKGADAFFVDDTAYAFLPEVKKYRVLLVTDEDADKYLKYALSSSKDIDLTIAVLPVLPEYDPYDVVVVGTIKTRYVLPRMFPDLEKYVKGGGHAVFLGSDALLDIQDGHFYYLLPVSLKQEAQGACEKISIAIEHEILTDVIPSGATSFPGIVASRYLETGELNGSVIIAEACGSPAIAYAMRGKGRSVYVGINPDHKWSNFHYSSSFPVFWMQLLSWVTRDDSSLGISNFRTGEYLPMIRDAVITSPSDRSLNATNLILDETGFYVIDAGGTKNTIAVSLLNDRESDIANVVKVDAVSEKGFHVPSTIVNVKQDLIPYVLGAVLLLLFAEVYYYKRRELL